VAFASGAYRLAFNANGEGPTIIMNMVWTLYNLALLGAAVSVASEAKQVRVTHRIAMRVPATLLFADGTTLACTTSDYSTGGLGLELPVDDLTLDRGQALHVTLGRGDRIFHFPARVTRLAGRHLGLQFEALSLEQERQFVQCTFGRADAWLSGEERAVDDMPLAGFKEVMLMGVEGYARLAQGAMRSVRSLLALDRARYWK
jgi:cellulose synthase (UDP-forming)